MRVGLGTDIHALVKGRPLVLGGVRIPHSKGLKGHSDADVLAHAVIDALLGAMGEGDIGELFPDTSAAYKNADSMKLLVQVAALMKRKGFKFVNLDSTVHAEEPKLKPYKKKIREALAKALGAKIDQVNVKAKTREGFGAVGQKKAMMAECVVLIKK